MTPKRSFNFVAYFVVAALLFYLAWQQNQAPKHASQLSFITGSIEKTWYIGKHHESLAFKIDAQFYRTSTAFKAYIKPGKHVTIGINPADKPALFLEIWSLSVNGQEPILFNKQSRQATFFAVLFLGLGLLLLSIGLFSAICAYQQKKLAKPTL